KPTAVASGLKPLFETGIAGINIEDGADAPSVLATKIEAIKRSTTALGVDVNQIRDVASGTELPLNVMAFPGLPGLADLARLGVRRLSAGSAMSQVLWQHVAGLAQRFLTEGDSSVFAEPSMSYGQLQALFTDARS